MLWRRPRYYAPWWLGLLAMFGFKYLVRQMAQGSGQETTEWRNKRKLFRQKLREAFMVWREPEDGSEGEEASSTAGDS